MAIKDKKTTKAKAKRKPRKKVFKRVYCSRGHKLAVLGGPCVTGCE
jgi:hypothetical protein